MVEGEDMTAYVASIWQCRYFWLSLVKMDLRTRYRRSLLGMGWSLLHPIAMTIILCIVFSRIFKPEACIRQYPAPMAIYPLRTALGGTVHFLIALSVVLCLAWCNNGFSNLSVI